MDVDVIPVTLHAVTAPLAGELAPPVTRQRREPAVSAWYSHGAQAPM
jgi:hypothetical protein